MVSLPTYTAKEKNIVVKLFFKGGNIVCAQN